MSAYNHVTLVGEVIKDPEFTKVGRKSRADFTIGVERHIGKDSEPEVDYFNIVTNGKLAEISNEYLKAGKKVLVDGRVQVRSYEENNQRKWITEVIAENLKFITKNGK